MTAVFLYDRLQSGFGVFFLLCMMWKDAQEVFLLWFSVSDFKLITCTVSGNFMSAVKHTRARYFPLDPQQSQNTLNASFASAFLPLALRGLKSVTIGLICSFVCFAYKMRQICRPWARSKVPESRWTPFVMQASSLPQQWFQICSYRWTQTIIALWSVFYHVFIVFIV